MTAPDPFWTCARCDNIGILNLAVFTRPEGRVCYVCVDKEAEPENRDDHEPTTEAMAFHAQMQHRERTETQELLILLDREITVVHDAGFPTSPLSDRLDELWEHLGAHKRTKNITEARYKEITGDE